MSDIPLHTLVDDYDITPVINTNNGYNYYLCTDCLTLWVRISFRERCVALWDIVFQWLATGRWFNLGLLVSSINKTDRYDITEILLKVEAALLVTVAMSFIYQWTLRWYHHASPRYNLSAGEWYNHKDH
jgi:hypothetical protein